MTQNIAERMKLSEVDYELATQVEKPSLSQLSNLKHYMQKDGIKFDETEWNRESETMTLRQYNYIKYLWNTYKESDENNNKLIQILRNFGATKI